MNPKEVSMNLLELQLWLNQKIKSENLNIPFLKPDGLAGPITRSTFIQVFVNRNARAITEEEKLIIAQSLGESTTKRIQAVAKVESAGSGWFNNGLVKILFERHYFYKSVLKTINWLSFGYLAAPSSGGYTVDVDKNGINDNWDKLAAAVCINPDGALQSVSIGSFQVMGKWYKDCGYAHPLDMLWDARNNEFSHWKMLAGFIKANNLVGAFRKISTNPDDCVPFVKAYNGPAWKKNDYANKLAKAMQ